MNLLQLIPEKLRKTYLTNIRVSRLKTTPEKYLSIAIISGLFVSAIISTTLYFKQINLVLSFIISFLLVETTVYFRLSLKANKNIKKMEEFFPDFIQLMASNLRAGMTIDKAFLSSARPEFYPLNKEVLRTGREIATGQNIVYAFKNMEKRIPSEKIRKTLYLLITGIKAGGNISVLLETTASNMKEKEFLEKKTASNVLMYVIFIAAAIGVGAPLLFGLSTVLVEVIIALTAQIPEVGASNMNIPITFSSIGITPRFMVYFSILFMLAIDFISTLIIGLVNKGSEKEGLKYFFPLAVVSLIIFFGVRILFSRFISQLFNFMS